MRVIKNKTGNTPTIHGEYNIATTTAIEIGEVVKLTADKVVAVAAAETTAILGISAENHTGAADALNTRSNGTKILIEDSPTAVYECEAPEITATSGTTTTIVSTSGLSTDLADNDFIGGYAKLTYKGSSSTNTDPVGTIYTISDSDASNQDVTINTAGGAVTAGDKFKIFPPFGFQKGNFDSDGLGMVYSASAAVPLKVVGRDLDKETIELYAAFHLFGNDVD
jgi:hypothetical protein